MFVLVYVHFVSSYLYARRIGLSHKTREYTLYGYYDDKNNELVKISLGGGSTFSKNILPWAKIT